MAATWEKLAYAKNLPALPYVVGDLIYANSTSTLAKLAGVAVGSVLVSGGSGAAPAWSATPSVTSLTTSRLGHFGTYDAAQVQGIWSIDPAYPINIAGNNFAGHVGIGYANGVGGAPFASQHQIVFSNYGATIEAAITLSGWAYFNGYVGIGQVPTGTSDLYIYRNADANYPGLIIEAGALSGAGFPYFSLKDSRAGGNQWNCENGRVLGAFTYYSTASGTVLSLTNTGNIGLNTTTFGTSAAKVLGIGSGTAPTTAPADMAQMWVQDVNAAAGYAGLHKRTETTDQVEVVPGVIIKTNTGSPANPYEGLMEINTFDNKVRMYADAGWRELGTW
jgi:hypothetical protein